MVDHSFSSFAVYHLIKNHPENKGTILYLCIRLVIETSDM